MHTLLAGLKLSTVIMDIYSDSPQNTKSKIIYDPAIPLLDLLLKKSEASTIKRSLHYHVHCGTAHNSQILGPDQRSWWKNGLWLFYHTHRMACIYEYSDIYSIVDYSKWNKPSIKGKTISQLYVGYKITNECKEFISSNERKPEAWVWQKWKDYS